MSSYAGLQFLPLRYQICLLGVTRTTEANTRSAQLNEEDLGLDSSEMARQQSPLNSLQEVSWYAEDCWSR